MGERAARLRAIRGGISPAAGAHFGGRLGAAFVVRG